MKQIIFFITICIGFNCSSTAQQQKKDVEIINNTDWKTLEIKPFSIQYPSNWKPDDSGTNGTTFFLFSPFENTDDTFSENVNLLLQNLPDKKMDLEGYVKLTNSQIKDNPYIQDIEIIENKTYDKNNYHQMIFKGTQNGNKFTYYQRYWVMDHIAIILTFTAQQNTYSKYLPIGEKILNTFKITEK